MVKTVLLLADHHVGSKLGLLYPFKGYTFHNAAQEHLWECRKHMLSRLPRAIDVTVHLGEIIDGPANSKKKKYSTLVTRLEDQRRIAKKLLDPIRKRSKKFYCLIGSEYHVDEWGEAARAVAKYIGADPVYIDKDEPDNNEYACYNLFLQFDDVVIDLAHHASVAMVNRIMVLEREIRYRKIDNPITQNLDEQELREKLSAFGLSGSPRVWDSDKLDQLAALFRPPEIKCIVRAHSHIFGMAWDRHGIAVRCPGWQFPYYDYGVAKSAVARSYPDIGWILLKVTPGKEWPIEVHPCLYDYPKAEMIKIT